MLGKLAKKLRLLGFDTLYFSDIDDKSIIEICKNEARIVLTKDVMLSKKLEKEEIKNFLFYTDNELENLLKIKNKLKINLPFVLGNKRCTLCNSLLRKSDLREIEKKIPPKVIETNNEFWFCQKCNKVYWNGSHIKNLQELVKKLNE